MIVVNSGESEFLMTALRTGLWNLSLSFKFDAVFKGENLLSAPVPP